MTDTTLHELCKGYGALLSRSKTPQFAEEARRANDRGNLPLHAACSFQATRDAVDALLRAHPPGAAHPNGVGNLPLHQAAMWQAPSDVVELLLSHHPGGRRAGTVTEASPSTSRRGTTRGSTSSGSSWTRIPTRCICRTETA